MHTYKGTNKVCVSVVWLLVESTASMLSSSHDALFHRPDTQIHLNFSRFLLWIIFFPLSESCIALVSYVWHREESKSIYPAACLVFILHCIESVCVTQIMRVDLCGISQLLQFLTIKWDIPQDPFIEAHWERREEEFIISWPLTVESHQSFFFLAVRYCFCLLCSLLVQLLFKALTAFSHLKQAVSICCKRFIVYNKYFITLKILISQFKMNRQKMLRIYLCNSNSVSSFVVVVATPQHILVSMSRIHCCLS